MLATERIMAERGFEAATIARVAPDNPGPAGLRRWGLSPLEFVAPPY